MNNYLGSVLGGKERQDFAAGPMHFPAEEEIGSASFLELDNSDRMSNNRNNPSSSPSSSSPPTSLLQPTAVKEHEGQIQPPEEEQDGGDDVHSVQQPEGEAEDHANTRPSNEYVLNVAFFSFLGFTIVQGFFAVLAKSESMLTDTEAMAVDAVTYMLNLFAERIKNQPYSDYERFQLSKVVRERRRTMKRLYLELIPPLISVSVLVAVTIASLQESFGTLLNNPHDNNDLAMDGTGTPDDDDDVNVNIMLIFSGINLLLDIVNVTCFARAHQAFGITSFVGVTTNTPQAVVLAAAANAGSNNTSNNDHHHDHHHHHTEDPSNKNGSHHEYVKMTSRSVEVEFDRTQDGEDDDVATEHTPLIPHKSGALTPTSLAPPKDEFYGINLNMCSAWTHVCADTLRSCAVLVAAGIATVVPTVHGDEADAVAAVVVSIIILMSLMPLLHGLFLTAREIYVLSQTPVHDEHTTTSTSSSSSRNSNH